MNSFMAVGYHGTNSDISKVEDINFYYKQYQDHFLGRGFYLFRDSHKRALNWTQKQHCSEKGSKNCHNILEAKIEVPENEILNFSSSNWTYEEEFLELYSDICKKYKIHFGSFIDIMIDEFSVDIKALTMIDLKTKNHIVPINSRAYSLFAYGDIQICVKNRNIIKEFKKMDIE